MNNDPVELARIRRVDLVEEIKALSATAIRTTFIHCLSKLEDDFGELWGEFKDENIPLTADEEKFLKLFEAWRKDILDFGNLQIRMLDRKIEQKKSVTF